MGDHQLQVRTESSDPVTVVWMAGEIDLATVDLVNEQFQALADAGLTDLVLEMSEITFVDSTGIHALVEGKRLIHERGSNIVLVPSPSVRRLFDLVFQGQRYAQRAESLQEAIAIIEGRKAKF